MLTPERMTETVSRYGDMLYRLCLVMLRNTADAEDAVQETFISYMQRDIAFPEPSREKAWLLTAAANKCRDMLRYRKRHRTEPAELLDSYIEPSPDRSLLEALMAIPDKYRLALELHYIEGYKIAEIAEMTDSTPSAVKMRLSKGRKLLREEYTKGE